ncbi:unnamed protein product [Notodromas monacha]|uniref:Protein tweety homolog n=1 Tax=Notodromas monacha TaxID=399045 RepID=A0A7R9BRX0_9CRUS|nr:unnamed protein product [Notodromas monacha]CAG0919647.1 unnamed protein product [Notodromas monacha]
MGVPTTFNPSWFVQLFHSRPHWDISLRVVNDTFDLKNEMYRETLGLWGSVPAVVLIISLIILLFYLLAYCCRRKTAKKKRFEFLRWVLMFFGLVCCGILTCAMYGSHLAHISITDFVQSVEKINLGSSSAKNQTDEVAGKLHKDVEPRVGLLSEEFSRQDGDPRVRIAIEEMSGNVSEAKNRIAVISGKISHAEYSAFTTLVSQIEMIRAPVTLALFGLFILFCLILMIGLIKRSRCTLMLFSVLGLVATVVCGLLVCAFFVIAMGLSDICQRPDEFVLNHLGEYPPPAIAQFYVKCHPVADNPFEQYISDGIRATTNIQTSLNVVSEIAEKFGDDQRQQHRQLHPNLVKLGQAVNATNNSIRKLNEALQCRPIHKEYVFALNSGCNDLINYLNTEETDPFLPQGKQARSSGQAGAGSLGRRTNIAMTGSLGPTYRARHYSNTHTPPQTPPFPSTLNGRMIEADPRYAGYHHAQYHGYATQAHPGAQPVSSISTLPGPNHGQYATLSRHCKTLESSSFY